MGYSPGRELVGRELVDRESVVDPKIIKRKKATIGITILGTIRLFSGVR